MPATELYLHQRSKQRLDSIGSSSLAKENEANKYVFRNERVVAAGDDLNQEPNFDCQEIEGQDEETSVEESTDRRPYESEEQDIPD